MQNSDRMEYMLTPVFSHEPRAHEPEKCVPWFIFVFSNLT